MEYGQYCIGSPTFHVLSSRYASDETPQNGLPFLRLRPPSNFSIPHQPQIHFFLLQYFPQLHLYPMPKISGTLQPCASHDYIVRLYPGTDNIPTDMRTIRTLVPFAPALRLLYRTVPTRKVTTADILPTFQVPRVRFQIPRYRTINTVQPWTPTV
jgi:hypothetical protein